MISEECGVIDPDDVGLPNVPTRCGSCRSAVYVHDRTAVLPQRTAGGGNGQRGAAETGGGGAMVEAGGGAMAESAPRRIWGFGYRGQEQVANVTALLFPSGTFDTVDSLIGWHHVLDWKQARAEPVRALTSGEVLVSDDHLGGAPTRLLSRFIARGELRPSMATLPLANIRARESTTIPHFRASRDGEE